MADIWQAHRIVTIHDPKYQLRKVRVDFEFDLDRLAKKLGAKALRNKKRASALAIGLKATAKILE